jgi:hypothetical protein
MRQSGKQDRAARARSPPCDGVASHRLMIILLLNAKELMMEGFHAAVQTMFVFGTAIPWGRVNWLMVSVFVMAVAGIASSRGDKANK